MKFVPTHFLWMHILFVVEDGGGMLRLDAWSRTMWRRQDFNATFSRTIFRSVPTRWRRYSSDSKLKLKTSGRFKIHRSGNRQNLVMQGFLWLEQDKSRRVATRSLCAVASDETDPNDSLTIRFWIAGSRFYHRAVSKSIPNG